MAKLIIALWTEQAQLITLISVLINDCSSKQFWTYSLQVLHCHADENISSIEQPVTVIIIPQISSEFSSPSITEIW